MSLLLFFTALVVKFGSGNQVISCGDTESYSPAAGEEKLYQFTLPSDGSWTELTFSTCNTPNIDTVLTLYTDSSGTNVVSDCDDCGSCSYGYQEIWVIDPSAAGLLAGGTYFIGVRFYSNTQTGSFTLDFTCRINSDSPTMLPTNIPTVQPTVVTNMPTSSPTVTRTEISCGFSTQGSINSTDIDYYKFTYYNDGSMVQLDFSTCNDGSTDPFLVLFTDTNDNPGTYIDHCNDCGNSSCGTQENWSFNPNHLNLISGQSYFIGVGSWYYTSLDYNFEFNCHVNSTSPTMTPTTETYSPTNIPTMSTNSPTSNTFTPTNTPTTITVSPTALTSTPTTAPTIFRGQPYASLREWDKDELPQHNQPPYVNIIFYVVTYFFKAKLSGSSRELTHGIQVSRRNISYSVQFRNITYEISTLEFYKTGIYELSIISVGNTCLQYPVVRIGNGLGTGQIVSEMHTLPIIPGAIGNWIYTSVFFDITDTKNYYIITDVRMEQLAQSSGCSFSPWEFHLDIKITYVAEL